MGSNHSTLDINRCSKNELLLLKWIGPVLAERIIAQRQKMSFESVDDLIRRVNGIGPRSWKRICAQNDILISFREPSPCAPLTIPVSSSPVMSTQFGVDHPALHYYGLNAREWPDHTAMRTLSADLTAPQGSVWVDGEASAECSGGSDPFAFSYDQLGMMFEVKQTSELSLTAWMLKGIFGSMRVTQDVDWLTVTIIANFISMPYYTILWW